MDIQVKIGPVPACSARVWIVAAENTMAVLRGQHGPEVPWDVIVAFDRYIAEWRAVAFGGDEVFFWSAEVDERIVSRVGLHWARIASIIRSGRSTIATAPPEAAAFYDAVATGIAAALALGSESAAIAGAFDDAVPEFAEPVRADVPDSPIRVVLVDDNDDFRLLLRVHLEGDGDFVLVGEAADVFTAVQVAKATEPDVVILNLDMPTRDGFDALPLVASASPATGVIVYSTEPRRLEALSAGAVTFLPKTTPPAAVLDAARRAVRQPATC